MNLSCGERERGRESEVSHGGKNRKTGREIEVSHESGKGGEREEMCRYFMGVESKRGEK